MRGPDYVLEKAQTRYRSVWRDTLLYADPGVYTVALPYNRCWYWGDLDRHGFTLLSRARTMVPQLASLLMEPGDIETYRPLGVEEDLDRYDQPDSTLTLAEVSALAALQFAGGKYLRTEQERIPISDAEHALEQARNHAQPNTTEA